MCKYTLRGLTVFTLYWEILRTMKDRAENGGTYLAGGG